QDLRLAVGADGEHGVVHRAVGGQLHRLHLLRRAAVAGAHRVVGVAARVAGVDHVQAAGGVALDRRVADVVRLARGGQEEVAPTGVGAPAAGEGIVLGAGGEG